MPNLKSNETILKQKSTLVMAVFKSLLVMQVVFVGPFYDFMVLCPPC